MCGIVGIIGKNAGKSCYDALEKLEYRGYDSAGVAEIDGNEILVFKRQGRVQNVKNFCENSKSKIMIGHTRWATHGMPCEKNAHPILSSKKQIAIIHNGIIENFKKLKEQLQKNGVVFQSDTDTEVACNQIQSETGSPLEMIKKATEKFVGSFAIACVFEKQKEIFVAKKTSPLYVAKTKMGNMVASDILCFDEDSEFHALCDNEFAILSEDRIEVFDKDLNVKKVKFEKSTLCREEIELCGFKHFMQKEIFEIPAVIKRICSNFEKKSEILPALEMFKKIENIEIVACGTAYHASLYGAKILQERLKIPANARIASEFRYGENVLKKNTLVILVSQSGETADTLCVGEMCKRQGIKVLSITNAQNSSIARLADVNLHIFAGKEIGVASTKAYVAMILMFYVLSGYLSCENFNVFEIEKLEKQVEKMLSIDERIVDLVARSQRIFFIGRQFDSITALEGALKLKEISYKSAEGYPAGELKHGTLALIEKGTPVFVISTDEKIHEKTMSNAEEVHSREGKIILISPKGFEKGCSDFQITFDKNPTELCQILAIIPLQLLALETAKKLNLNPDKPRNLAKSVTVE